MTKMKQQMILLLTQDPFSSFIEQQQLMSTGTHPFKSSAIRNAINSSKTPGPGSYEAKYQQNTAKYHKVQSTKNELPKQYIWIVKDERTDFIGYQQSNKLIGPGSYNINKKGTEIHSPGWARQSRFHTNKDQRQNLPGPGFYDYQSKNHSNGVQSVFKSRSPKLIFQNQSQSEPSSLKGRVLSSENNQSNDKTIEIVDIQKLKTLQKSPAFASKVPRFGHFKKQIQELGPGSYDVQDVKIKVRRYLPHLKKNKIQRRNKQHIPFGKNMTQQKQVGPGEYDLDYFEINKEVEKVGYAVSRQTRFNFSKRKKNASSFLPGPGTYMANKFVFISKEDYPLKKKHRLKAKSVHSFQNPKQPPNPKPSPGDYNLNMFDINYNLQKKVEHNDRLKLMEVRIPAFNCKAQKK